jgi:hypothetical protein
MGATRSAMVRLVRLAFPPFDVRTVKVQACSDMIKHEGEAGSHMHGSGGLDEGRSRRAGVLMSLPSEQHHM